MFRRVTTATGAVVLAVGLVTAVGGGVAAAHGDHGKKPVPVTATGTTTCNYHGRLVVSPSGTIAIAGNLTPHHHSPACSNQGGTKLRSGHLSHLESTATTTGICSLLSGGTLPDVSNGTIRWSPKPKVAASTGVALTGGTVSTVTKGSDTFLQVTYSDGSVAGGSFTNASGASLTATSRKTVAQLTADCAKGPVNTLALAGSLTL